QANEMHAVVVETLPAPTQRSSTKTFPIEFTVVSKHIVLARHVVNLTRTRTFHDLRGRVKLLGRSQMRDITRVNHKRRPLLERVDLVNRLLQCLCNIVIRIPVEPDMTIANLNKAEACGFAFRSREQLV